MLSKIDLLSEHDKTLLDTFLETDPHSILDMDGETPWNKRYRSLTQSIASVLEDYSLVYSFGKYYLEYYNII